MKILSIETSCDETALCLLQAQGDLNTANFTVLGNTLLSQVEHHAQFGGVYPTIAKREHTRNLIPLLTETLQQANMFTPGNVAIPNDVVVELKTIFAREPELFVQFATFITQIQKPDIDAIAVTTGPGLEPALWTGINLARALSLVWDTPVIPTNHMEGHIVASLAQKDKQQDDDETETLSISRPEFPALALLVSGGHTELVRMRDWLQYELIGQTRDDAVGEAFDKVARLLELPYPGGPEISKLAQKARDKNIEQQFVLPRPMRNSENYDFSFSGIKTAVLYTLKNKGELADEQRMDMAREFEDAVIEVLIEKTKKAQNEYDIRSLILGGGVSANSRLRTAFEDIANDKRDEIDTYIPQLQLTTDNAVMIALAAYVRYAALNDKAYTDTQSIRADANASVSP